MSYELMETTSEEAFIEKSVALLEGLITAAIDDHGFAIIGLSGGSTPKPIYAALGKRSVEWSLVSVFLVDERYVDPTSPDSNQQLVRETLLTHADIPEDQLVFPDTSLPIGECVDKYSFDLKAMWTDRLPDLVTLGLGPDGHIASLFPPVDDLALGDERLVIHTKTEKFAVKDRITISLNAVCAAQAQVFFLKGEEKKEVWDEMLADEAGDKRWPAQRVLEAPEGVSVVTM